MPLFGPWNGKLNNASDTIELNKPSGSINGIVPRVVIDRVQRELIVPVIENIRLVDQLASSAAEEERPAPWGTLPTNARSMPPSFTPAWPSAQSTPRT